ncbi:MAG: hypothetical protein GY844_22665 [Bradyrhizobium sp.]|nr:hypothetical protein [Bradyrhizobium sp.]
MSPPLFKIAEGWHSAVDGGLGEWILTVFQLLPHRLACQLENYRSEA